MNFSSNYRKTTTIALVILMASVTLLTIPFQPVQAQYTNEYVNPYSIPLPAGVTPDLSLESIAHISFRPNPVGVGQPFLVNLWLQPPIHNSRGFSDYTVTMTKPDGTEDVIKINSYHADGTAWFEYVADQVGTWKIKFDFPGGYFPAGNYTRRRIGYADATTSFPASVYYKPDSDGPYELVVQEEMALSWPESPLPTDYWTRPVSPENREWWPILGNYPATGVVGGDSNWPADTNKYMSNYDYVPYVQAPNSAHIVWKRQDYLGGLIGGTMGDLTDYTFAQFGFIQALNFPSIIYAGRCYQTLTKVVDGTPQNVWQCYDLRTGEVYWEQTGVTQVPTMISYVEREGELVPGEQARKSGMGIYLLYVGGGMHIRYNPMTGAVVSNVSISPLTTGTFYADPYFLTVQTLGSGAARQYRLINWTVGTHPTTGRLAFYTVNNITWPFSSLGTVDYEAGIAVSTQGISHPATQVTVNYRLMAASLTTGQLLWNITADTGYGFFSGSTACADHGKYAVRFNDGHWHCWDLLSGKKLWKSELSSWPWATFGSYHVASYGGMILSAQYDGVSALDWDTGKIVWHFAPKTPYAYETVYQDYYPSFMMSGCRTADGKLFVYNVEHSVSQPVTRGWRLHCVNLTTGEGIWNITGSLSAGAIADGYLTAGNMYDGYMYVFGKGKSATTVTANPAISTHGSTVMIQGTVMDQSPAQPNTPCVSKESMTEWMEYLHMQKQCPADVKGVTVSLDTLDPNGNYVHIGDVTTDMSGTFGFMWEPEVPGHYTVMATFLGDDSYGSSWAETHVGVVEAPAASATPEPPQTSPDNTLLMYAILVAVIVAIVIGLLALFRKR